MDSLQSDCKKLSCLIFINNMKEGSTIAMENTVNQHDLQYFPIDHFEKINKKCIFALHIKTLYNI